MFKEGMWVKSVIGKFFDASRTRGSYDEFTLINVTLHQILPLFVCEMNDGGKSLSHYEMKNGTNKETRTHHFWLAVCGWQVPRELFWRNYADRSSHGCRVLCIASAHSSFEAVRDIVGSGLSRDDS